MLGTYPQNVTVLFVGTFCSAISLHLPDSALSCLYGTTHLFCKETESLMFAAFLLKMLMMSKGVSPPFVEFPSIITFHIATKRLNATTEIPSEIWHAARFQE